MSGDGDDREIHIVKSAGVRIDRTRSGRTGAAADDVAADDEITVGIDRFAGTDHRVPPARLGIVGGMNPGDMRISGQRVFDQNRIAPVRRQRTVGFITDIDVEQLPAAIQPQCVSVGHSEGEIPGNDYRGRFIHFCDRYLGPAAQTAAVLTVVGFHVDS